MDNHVHMVIKEIKEEIGRIMKRIGTSYAYWYNWKYNRIGHVFQDRYKSEWIEEDRYLIIAIRYIHNNPVKAGMIKKAEKYVWSSCSTYYGEKEYPRELTQLDVVLGIFSNSKKTSIGHFRKYMKEENDNKCLEDERCVRINDERLKKEIKKLIESNQISTLQNMERTDRDKILKQVKEIEGSSLRQIARVTGIGYNIIVRA